MSDPNCWGTLCAAAIFLFLPQGGFTQSYIRGWPITVLHQALISGFRKVPESTLNGHAELLLKGQGRTGCGILSAEAGQATSDPFQALRNGRSEPRGHV